ncbi:MAG: hypothetical protein MJ232_00950 [archaeon]|nr:hypothetical protein [archaeon]
MLYEYCINNDLSKERILKVLKEYDSIKKFETNNVEDVIKECNEFGLEYVSKKYNVHIDDLKQYPYFRFKKRDKEGKKREPVRIPTKPTNPVVDIFD